MTDKYEGEMNPNHDTIGKVGRILLGGYFMSVAGLAAYTYAALLYHFEIGPSHVWDITVTTLTELISAGGIAGAVVVVYPVTALGVVMGVSMVVVAPIIGIGYIYHITGQQIIRSVAWVLTHTESGSDD